MYAVPLFLTLLCLDTVPVDAASPTRAANFTFRLMIRSSGTIRTKIASGLQLLLLLMMVVVMEAMVVEG